MSETWNRVRKVLAKNPRRGSIGAIIKADGSGRLSPLRVAECLARHATDPIVMRYVLSTLDPDLAAQAAREHAAYTAPARARARRAAIQARGHGGGPRKGGASR